MNIHVDPPRHTHGDICYRAIIEQSCPLGHSYNHTPITVDELDQLAWIRALKTAINLPAETRIVRSLWNELKRNGTPIVATFDSEERVKISSEAELLENAFAVDDVFLETETGAWVRIINGNGWDALVDYSVSLESRIQETLALVDKEA